MSEENEQLVRSFYASCSLLDVEAVVSHFAEDGVWEDKSVSLHARGHCQIRAFCAEAARQAAQNRIQIINQARKGNLVFTERYDQLSSPAGQLEYPVVSVIEIENGMIRHAREYWDGRTALRLAPGEEPTSRPVPPRHVDAGPIMEDPATVVLQFMEANSRLDVDAMVAVFAEDGFYEDRPSGFHPRGRRQLRGLFKAFRSVLSGLPGVGIEPVNWASNGNLVFVERIDRFDLPARQLAVPVLTVAEIEGGKIKYMREYWDKTASGLPEDPRQLPE